MGASNGHFTVSGPLHHGLFTRTPRACCLERPCLLTSRKNEVYSSLSLVFENRRLSDQVQMIAWHGIKRQIIWIFCRESEVSG